MLRYDVGGGQETTLSFGVALHIMVVMKLLNPLICPCKYNNHTLLKLAFTNSIYTAT